MVERETLTTETLGVLKWRGTETETDCDTREKENAIQIWNLSLQSSKNPIQRPQSIQNALKSVSRSQNQRHPKEMEENGAKTKASESLKNLNPNEPS